MNILEGVKPSGNPKTNNTKFIIKSKPSAKENKTLEPDNEVIYATNGDAHQFLTYLVSKSRRLADFLEEKSIDSNEFSEKHLYANPAIRTLLKSIMDKMLTDRRLGKNLKGINKSIMQEIETAIWQSIEREATLYQLNTIYHQEKRILQEDIKSRREAIQRELEALSGKQIEQSLLQPIVNTQQKY